MLKKGYLENIDGWEQFHFSIWRNEWNTRISLREYNPTWSPSSTPAVWIYFYVKCLDLVGVSGSYKNLGPFFLLFDRWSTRDYLSIFPPSLYIDYFFSFNELGKTFEIFFSDSYPIYVIRQVEHVDHEYVISFSVFFFVQKSHNFFEKNYKKWSTLECFSSQNTTPIEE